MNCVSHALLSQLSDYDLRALEGGTQY